MSPAQAKRADVLKAVEDKGLEHLDEVVEILLSAARGMRVLVAMDAAKPRSGSAHRLGTGRAAESFCPVCHRPTPGSPGEPVEVWRIPPDITTARYVHEHLAGKARAREEQQLDPIINIHFPPIDTVYNLETPSERSDQDRDPEADIRAMQQFELTPS